MIGAAATLLALVAPATAQMYAPFGAPGVLTVPEVASGAIAGAANSAAQQQQHQCTQTVVGRGGLQTMCPTDMARPKPHR